MTTRRRFLQTETALSLAPGRVSIPDPSRLALIIGNNAYPDSPLKTRSTMHRTRENC